MEEPLLMTASMSHSPLPDTHLPAKTMPSFGRMGTLLVLSMGVFLAGCVGVVDPRRAEAEKNAAATAGGIANTAPANSATPAAMPANLPKAMHAGPLSPIGEASASSRQVATLATPVDIWDRIRRGYAMPDLNNDIVRDKEQWYASRPEYIQRMTDRSNRYLFHIVEEIERRGMPSELALLPFIESAFNPQAVSSARAAGMWQFMPATGESFDLKQNMFRDDRRDVLASTSAALDYLEQLHGRFGDWHLALAAYNWGQGNVNRAITRNQKAGLPTDYDSLDMPAETRQYVPKLQAVKNIVASPGAFSASLPDIGNHPYFDTISISQDIDVALVIRLAEIKEADFRALNPSLKQPVVMAAGTPQILLPWDNANMFETRLAEHKGPLATWTAWVVPSTLSATDAAKRVGMSEDELRSVNNIPPRMLVRSGSSLLVRRSAQRNNDVSEYVADNARLSFQPEVVWRKTTVRVRRGENLNSLADRYGVTVASITSLNKLSRNARLRSGQRIAVMLPSNQSTKVVVTRASKQAKSPSSSSSAKSAPRGSQAKIKNTSLKRSSKTSASKSKGSSKSKSGSGKKSTAPTAGKKKKRT
jgi:membrane-bound lytic murein transglycosylase D